MSNIDVLFTLCYGVVGCVSIPVWLRLVSTSWPRVSSTRCRAAVHAVGMVAVSTGMGWRFCDDPALFAWLWAGWCSLGLAVIDVHEHRLPRNWVRALGLGALLVFTLIAVLRVDLMPLLRALVAGAAVWMSMRLAEAVCAGAMGAGDTRLQAVLAVLTGWISWQAVLWGLVIGTLLLGITASLAWFAGRRGWRARVPAGPSLLAGTWCAVFHFSF